MIDRALQNQARLTGTYRPRVQELDAEHRKHVAEDGQGDARG
jgi:hypothetical protein